ncbi:hypothetical protein ACHQM5_005131 [Ranunculus cassubicifolius]
MIGITLNMLVIYVPKLNLVSSKVDLVPMVIEMEILCLDFHSSRHLRSLLDQEDHPEEDIQMIVCDVMVYISITNLAVITFLVGGRGRGGHGVRGGRDPLVGRTTTLHPTY